MMKIDFLYFLPVCILLFSCGERKTSPDGMENEVSEKYIQEAGLQAIMDSAGVRGSVLVYDPGKDIYSSNDFSWAKKGRLPASTFKIPNSVIALELGVVEDDKTLFEWNGERRRMKSWERDMTFREAFHRSCVPCYQEVAREIGVVRMKEYLAKYEYGSMVVDSSSIDNFWLVGNSAINQFQQIEFLKRLYQSKLPISERTGRIMRQMMVIGENDRYRLSGKTGWSIREGKNNGWFVGYITAKGKTYFFATNIVPGENFDMDMFSKTRKDVTFRSLRKLNIPESINIGEM